MSNTRPQRRAVAHWNPGDGAWTVKREGLDRIRAAAAAHWLPDLVITLNETGDRTRELRRYAERIGLHFSCPDPREYPGGPSCTILTSAEPRHVGCRLLLPKPIPHVTHKPKVVTWVRMPDGWIHATTHMPAHPDTSKGQQRTEIRQAYRLQRDGLLDWYDERAEGRAITITADMNTTPGSPLLKPSMHKHGLRQVVDRPTFGRRILDHGYLNREVQVESVTVLEMPRAGGRDDHEAPFIIVRRAA